MERLIRFEITCLVCRSDFTVLMDPQNDVTFGGWMQNSRSARQGICWSCWQWQLGDVFPPLPEGALTGSTIEDA